MSLITLETLLGCTLASCFCHLSVISKQTKLTRRGAGWFFASAATWSWVLFFRFIIVLYMTVTVVSVPWKRVPTLISIDLDMLTKVFKSGQSSEMLQKAVKSQGSSPSSSELMCFLQFKYFQPLSKLSHGKVTFYPGKARMASDSRTLPDAFPKSL